MGGKIGIFCSICRAIKQGMVLGLHVGVYSKDDTMAHTRRLVVKLTVEDNV